MWKTPRRKPFRPAGLALGATVVGSDFTGQGQIWAKAKSAYKCKQFWVVTPDCHAHLCTERDLIVLGQCIDQPLPNIHAA